jgi:hypothetical protein
MNTDEHGWGEAARYPLQFFDAAKEIAGDSEIPGEVAKGQNDGSAPQSIYFVESLLSQL